MAYERPGWFRYVTAAVFSLVFFVAACSDEPDPFANRVLDDNGGAFISAFDREYDAAIDEAQDNLADFLRALRQPGPSQSGFQVLAPFGQGVLNHESLWVGDLSYDGKIFSGRIVSDPVSSGTKFGERVRLIRQDVMDWFYVDHGVLVGGYTIRLLRSRMSASERADFDSSFPYRFE